MEYLSSLFGEYKEQLELNDRHGCSQNKEKLTDALKFVTVRRRQKVCVTEISPDEINSMFAVMEEFMDTKITINFIIIVINNY